LALRSSVRIKQKRWADALADLDLALETASPDAELHAIRGEALRGLGRLADAEAAWRLSLKLRPKHARTMYVLGLLLSNRLGRPADAAVVLRELVEVKPSADNAWNELGNSLKRLRDYEGALAAYRKARELQPKDLMYAGNEGALLIDMNRPQAAYDILAEVVRQNPENMIDRFNLAVALSDLGRKDDAIAQYAEVARRNPKDGEAWTKAAALQAEMGRLDDAIASVRHAIEAEPKAGAYQHDLALYLLRAKRPQEAEVAARKAVDLAPAEHHSYYLIGRILSDREEWEASLPYLRKAMELAPNESDYCGRAIWILVVLDRHTDALDLLSGAVQRFPDKWWVHAQMGWALSDAPDLAVRDTGLAILHARKATEIAPKVAWAWLALGAALYRADRHAEAVERIRTSLELEPEGMRPLASYYLSMALHRLGKTEEARAEFDRGEAARKSSNPEGRPEKGRPDRRLAAEAASVLGLPPPR
jgi:tetratricopeptide (TPR) repeat protein